MGPGINAVVTRVGNLGARSPGLIINNSELYFNSAHSRTVFNSVHILTKKNKLQQIYIIHNIKKRYVRSV